MEREQIGACTLYLGDCREVLPTLGEVNAVVTDPPYPDISKAFPYTPVCCLETLRCRQCIFWSAVAPFPLSYTGIHIWHKPNGQSSQYYERIFERHGSRTCLVYRVAAILPDYVQYRQECVPHPTQKPLALLLPLVARSSTTGQRVLDPFMGSGTTGVAALMLGRSFVGVEIERKYFDIACQRITDAYAQPDLFVPPPPRPEQQALFAGGR
jgi:DNA modification methylase